MFYTERYRMSCLTRIYNELFFSGLTREQYLQVKEPVNQTNRKSIISWSASIGMFWALSLILSLYLSDYTQCRMVYIWALVSSILTWFSGVFLIERFPGLLYPTKYLLTLSILMAGIGIALCQPGNRTATMIAVVVIIPNCFIDPTIASIITLGIVFVVYSILGIRVIEPGVYSWGLLNLAIFSLAGILTSHVINKTRFKRFLYEDSTKKMAEMEANFNAQLVMGMASMVESRDRFTGGHIRRTSTGVRFLVEAIQEDDEMPLSDEFCEKIIKAAPLHDLGKIAVDDEVLRKPGKYTPEEFEKMKIHAAEGARILKDILKGTDEEFSRIAQNVAHYHHERIDGTGYPDGLKGDEIPLEARIMAVADVYDALVSKRVYKERYSPQKADQIILKGMGSQFDPQLKKYYEAARPRLEEFYAKEQQENGLVW